MSFRTGDRARAHKIRTKRRLRRMQIQVFRRLNAPASEELETKPVPPPVPASIK